MDKEELTARLRSAVQDSHYRADVRLVALFGSQIHGTAGDGSDVDVPIEFDPCATIGLFEFIEIQEQFSEALGRKVDLLTPRLSASISATTYCERPNWSMENDLVYLRHMQLKSFVQSRFLRGV